MMSFSFFDFYYFQIVTLFLVFFYIVFQRKHFLMVLLAMELMMLCFFFSFFIIISSFGGDVFLSMVFLCFSVSEGSVGLSLLVSFVRSHGVDYVSVISVYECY